MVDINIPKIVKSYVPLHRSTPLNVWIVPHLLFLYGMTEVILNKKNCFINAHPSP